MFLGIDIGGTSVRVTAFADLENHTRIGGDEFRVSREYGQDFESLLRSCELMYGTYCEEYGGIEGIGLAIAGILDRGRTTLARAGNTRQWVEQPFVHDLGEYLGCLPVLGNDAEAAAMAEAIYGNPDGDDFWFVIWGTGVGGALLRNIKGQPVPLAGEMGHQLACKPKGRECACGQFDCLEAYCGGDMIRKYEGVPAEELGSMRWGMVLEYMASGLHSIVAIHPVPKVYFGGGIAAKQSQFIPVLEQMLREELQFVGAPSLELSRFGESAGTVGALALLKSKLA